MEKNMTLYNITDEYKRIMSEIEEAGGEITDDIATRMEINQQNLVEKAVGYGHVIQYYDALAAAAKAEADRVTGIQKMAEKAAANLKSRIVKGMEACGVDKVEDPTMRLSFRRSSSVEVPDLEKVPAEFVTAKVVKSPDKKKIKDFITDFGPVDWASLNESKNLQIK